MIYRHLGVIIKSAILELMYQENENTAFGYEKNIGHCIYIIVFRSKLKLVNNVN